MAVLLCSFQDPLNVNLFSCTYCVQLLLFSVSVKNLTRIIYLAHVMACLSFPREMNKRQTYEQANKVFDKAMKLEQEFGEYFTGKLLICLRVW